MIPELYDPGAWNTLDLTATQRAELLPQTADDVAACQDGCRGLPTTAYLGCVASCESGVNIPAGERNPPLAQQLPALNLHFFGDVAGLVKWIVAGVGLLVVYQLVR